MVAVVIAEGVAIVFLGLLVVGLLRSHADILKALHELGAGLEDTDAPARRTTTTHTTSDRAVTTAFDVSGAMPDDSAAAVSVVGARQDTVLAFLSTTCMSCDPFWDTFAGSFPLPDNTRLVVVVQEGDSKSKLRKLSPPDLLVIRSDEAWQNYDVPGSPHFVHVAAGSGQVTGEGTADTWQQVLDLLLHAGDGAISVGGRAAELPEGRDNAERIDRELAKSGIGPGDPSLYSSLDAPGSEVDA